MLTPLHRLGPQHNTREQESALWKLALALQFVVSASMHHRHRTLVHGGQATELAIPTLGPRHGTEDPSHRKNVP